MNTLRTAAGSESHSGIHVPIAASQSAAPGCGAEILCGSGVADRPSPGQVRGWREVVARLADSTACDAESFAGIKHNPARVGLGSARDSMTELELVDGYSAGSIITLGLVCALSISRAFGVWGIELSEQGVPAQRHDVMGASPAVYIHPERGKSRTVWTRGAASPGPQLALGVGLVSSGGAS